MSSAPRPQTQPSRQLARPRIDRPLGRVGEHGVGVREQEQRRPVARAPDPRDQVRPLGHARVELALDAERLEVERRSSAACVSLPGGLTVSRRISAWRRSTTSSLTGRVPRTSTYVRSSRPPARSGRYSLRAASRAPSSLSVASHVSSAAAPTRPAAPRATPASPAAIIASPDSNESSKRRRGSGARNASSAHFSGVVPLELVGPQAPAQPRPVVLRPGGHRDPRAGSAHARKLVRRALRGPARR